jgi:O-antigen/teichoic acid export membrane protein
MSETGAYRHSLIVACGEIVAGLCNFAYIAVLARLLGTSSFGQFAVVVAYAMALDLLFNFQSWRLVIRYGANELSNPNTSALSRVLKLSSILDMSSAVVATLLGVVLVPFATGILNDAQPDAFYIYCLTILFNLVGQPTGLLRLYNKYLFLSLHKSVTAVFRLIAVVSLFSIENITLIDAVVVVVVVECLSKIVLFVRGLFEARLQGIGNFYSVPLTGILSDHNDLFSFAIFSSLNDTVLKVVQQVDVFLVAVFLAPADAGFFRIIKSLGSVFSMTGAALAEVFYPEIAKIQVLRKEALKPVLRKLWTVLSAIALTGLIVYALVGDTVISLFFGIDFLDAFVPSFIYMIGAALGVILMPFTPLFLVRGQHRKLFVAYFAAAVAYVAVLTIGTIEVGLLGAVTAFPILYLVYYASIYFFERGGKN